MSSAGSTALGFLSAVQLDEGLAGGLLVLNATGRPLEFYCTAPIKPSRAQEILYGPTLGPYLVGEQIAPALIAKAASSLELLFGDTPDLYPAREATDAPLVWVDRQSPSTKASEPDVDAGATRATTSGPMALRVDGPHQGPPAPHSAWTRFAHEGRQLAVVRDRPEDRRRLIVWLEQDAIQLDVIEPFDRIREAIEETLSAGR